MAAQEVFVTLDLKGNVIKNVKAEVVTALPTASASTEGRYLLYQNTLYFDNGSKMVAVADAAVVSAIRTEIGDKPEDATGTIYARLKSVENAIGNDSSGNSLGTRVTNLETKVNDAETGLAKTKEIADGAQTAASSAQSDATKALNNAGVNANSITALGTRMTSAEGKITTLEDKVGKAAADGAEATGLFLAIQTAQGGVDKNKTDIAAVKATADAAAKASDVTTELAKKVDKVDGSRLMTDAEGTKLGTIDEGAQVNVIEKVTIDGAEGSITGKTVNFALKLDEYAKKADYTTVMRPMGSVEAIANLPSSSVEVGDVYNVQTKFTNSVDGKEYPAGTNVVYVKKTDGTFVWDPLGGSVDLSAYAKTTEVTAAISNATKDLATSEALTTELAKKVNKLADADAPVAGTYAKVIVDSQGLVKKGSSAKITEADIDGSIAATKLSGTIDKARLPTDIPAANIDGELALANIPSISLAGDKLTGVLPAAKLGLEVKTFSFIAGTSQAIAHGFNGVPFFVQAVDAAGNTVIGVTITRDATNITVSSEVEHPALTVYAIGTRV